MSAQRRSKRDWHRTWQPIHHQSHVAVGLCVAYECVLMQCVFNCQNVKTAKEQEGQQEVKVGDHRITSSSTVTKGNVFEEEPCCTFTVR